VARLIPLNCRINRRDKLFMYRQKSPTIESWTLLGFVHGYE